MIQNRAEVKHKHMLKKNQKKKKHSNNINNKTHTHTYILKGKINHLLIQAVVDQRQEVHTDQ